MNKRWRGSQLASVKGNVSSKKKVALEWEGCREATVLEKGVGVEDTL